MGNGVHEDRAFISFHILGFVEEKESDLGGASQRIFGDRNFTHIRANLVRC